MGLTLRIEPQKDYLAVYIEGEYNYPDTLPCVEGIMRACQDHQATKILLDVLGVRGSIPSMDRFGFAEAFAMKYFEFKKEGKISHARFALLGDYPILDPQRFGETVAVNRGMVVKTMTDRKEALDWLVVEP